MSAVDTAQRMLAWATAPFGPAPAGSVDGLGALGAADERTRDLLAELTRTTAARLGAGARPFGDRGPAGPGAVLLAVALAARAQPAVARRLARAVPAPEPGRHTDAVARHGVVRLFGPIAPTAADARQRTAIVTERRGVPVGNIDVGRPGALTTDLSDDLLDAVLEASPLTAVLYRPPSERGAAGATSREVELALELFDQPRGRTCLATALAAPSTDPLVLGWRSALLTAARATVPDAVIEVYLIARLRHGAAWDALLDSAQRELRRPGARTGQPGAVARYWAPLAALEREQRGAVRDNPFLVGYRPALDLLDRYQIAEAA